ncbi:hypothetical protein C8R46DRAFT_1056564 [Mycena filopes]|nr:hypothetical protein C8R46DRAFT_1056564 [Mycena filopes]
MTPRLSARRGFSRRVLLLFLWGACRGAPFFSTWLGKSCRCSRSGRGARRHPLTSAPCASLDSPPTAVTAIEMGRMRRWCGQ